MESAKTIYLIRHGECLHNLGKNRQTFAGAFLDNSLTPTGVKSAELLSDVLKEKKIDLIVASPLKRSIETAKIIAEKLNLPIKIFKEASEINVGDFSGHTKDEVIKLFPEEAENFYSGNIEKWVFPNGENYHQVVIRIKNFLNKLKKEKAKKILISGHAMTNRVILKYFFPEDSSKWRDREYPHNRIEYLNY